MKVCRVAAVIALLVGPSWAHAQMPNMNLIPELPSKSPEEKEADQARDKAYRESLKKIPDAKTASDPWGVVRSQDTPKMDTARSYSSKTAAPVKPKTKTGSNTN